MAEAQAQAAGCLRLLSLSDLVKVDVMAAGAVRFLTPLLESKLHHARWNARQVLPWPAVRWTHALAFTCSNTVPGKLLSHHCTTVMSHTVMNQTGVICCSKGVAGSLSSSLTCISETISL